MTYTLRPYQIQAAEAGAEYLLSKRKKNGIMVLPTGSGKSLCIAALAQRLDAPLIVLQPSKEILEQNLDKFHSYGIRPAVFSASMNRREVGEITLGTIGTVIKHPDLFSEFPFLVMDEAHLCDARPNARGEAKMYHSFFQQTKVKTLGLTASPYRLFTNSQGSELRFITRTVPRIFTDMVYWVQNKDLFDAGYLAKLEYYQIHGFKRSKVKLNSNGTDYNKESLQLHLFEPNWTEHRGKKKMNFQDKLAETVCRVMVTDKATPRKRVLVFTSSVAESQLLVSQVPGVAMVSAETPAAERKAIVRDFRSGALRVITNAGVFVVGLDVPEIDCVIDAAPTMSLNRYYQKNGRALRVSPDKESAWLIDMGGTYEQFGRIEDLTLYCEKERLWDVWGRPGGPDQKEVRLTSVLLAGGGRNLSQCFKCSMSVVFPFPRHEVTGNPARLSRPLPGGRANIVLRQNEAGKTVYAIVKPGDADYDQAEYVIHYRACKPRSAQ